MNNHVYPPGLSFFETYKRAFNLVKNPMEAMAQNLARFGDTYTVRTGISQRMIFTRDPAFIEYVLKRNHRNYNKSKIVSEKLGRFLGNGLLTSNGAYWLRQRRLIQPGFHIQKVQALYSIMKKTTDEFLSRFPTGKDVDLLPLMNAFAFEVVIHTLFDVAIPEESVKELGRFITDIQEFVVRDIRQPQRQLWHVLSGEVSKNKKRSAHAREILRKIIAGRKASGGVFNDLLDMLLQSRYEETGGGMTEEQIIDEILILIIAGHETTANALSWSLYLLASHPDELERLRHATRGISLSETVQHPHLTAVISESMRLYPPAWLADRVALQNDGFKDFSFAKGTIIILLFFAAHRNERFWKDSGLFNPGRFLPEADKKHAGGEERPRAFYPFGAGPRLCIGNNFALAEMAIFLQSFLERFTVTPGSDTPGMKPQVTLRPERLFLNVVSVSDVK